MGEAVGHGVELGVGEALAFEGDGGALGMLVHRRFDVVAQKPRGVGLDALQPAERPQERADEADLAFCPRDKTKTR